MDALHSGSAQEGVFKAIILVVTGGLLRFWTDAPEIQTLRNVNNRKYASMH